MAEHPIEGLMKTAMESIKDMVDVNTVVGDPVETQDGTVIIPISKVSFGFAAGGGEYGGCNTGGGNSEGDSGGGYGGLPFAGGSGAGVSVQPVGFLVVGHETVKLLPVHGGAALDRVLEAMPGLLNHLKSICRDRVPCATAWGTPPTAGPITPGPVTG